MLYFSKFKSFTIMIISFFGIIFALPNILSQEIIDSLPNILPKKQINLGLDLRGGSHLLIEVDASVLAIERMDNIYNDLRLELRKNKIDISTIDQRNDEITITISQASSIKDVFSILEELSQEMGFNSSGQPNNELDILEVSENTYTINLTDAAIDSLTRRSVDQSIEIVRRRIDELGTKEPSIQRQGKSRIIIQVPGLDDPQRLKELLGTTAKMTFHLMDPLADIDNMNRSSMVLYSRDKSDIPYIVMKRSIIGGDNLVDAQPGFDSQTNQPIVNFRFDGQGARKFGKITSDNVGKPFAIVLDNEVISSPIINEPILGGSGMISGSFSVQEANDLAILLRAGALPAPLIILEERTVGPDLGADSIKAGKIAAVLGLIFVLIYMFISYGRFGIYSNISLIINLSLIVSILSLLQATLTLPGIAGIILTIGMAVDANVLIFERIREELNNKKSPINAIDNGYKRALTTILDANITTFIAAIILFQLGSGPIKGFSITLAIGIITSVFTAFTLTRFMVARWLKKSNPKEINI
ncbi:MAG: protein translocase subunit SecD [Hyphomicrobiales bacterium]|nr:protein translocase subunit SecD [Hyphomicrobiales bacterium]